MGTPRRKLGGGVEPARGDSTATVLPKRGDSTKNFEAPYQRPATMPPRRGLCALRLL